MKPIEYLSQYLPYELTFLSSKHQFKYGEREIMLCNGMSIDTTGELNIEFRKDDYLYFSNSMNKVLPILRPLSDLTKEIEHNGEKFVPEKKLMELSYNQLGMFSVFEVKCGIELAVFPYDMMIKLISWHFDVFNLHEKGQCIYYDEINQQP